jgi:hypothetical protein
LKTLRLGTILASRKPRSADAMEAATIVSEEFSEI